MHYEYVVGVASAVALMNVMSVYAKLGKIGMADSTYSSPASHCPASSSEIISISA